MEQKVLQKLEFHKVLELLFQQCSSPLGRELAQELRPSCDLVLIQTSLAETSEAKEILRLFPGFSLGGVRDIRAALRRAEAGGIIEAGEFLQIYDTLSASKRLKDFFMGEGNKYNILAGYAEALVHLPVLEQQIKKCITPEGEVSDQASDELAKIRRQQRSLEGKVREKLEALLRSADMQKYLQEPLITMRNERYVVPVKVEYRGQVPGLIHDQSGSGATIFVEPMAVVELNNETQRLEAAEKAEVVRILRLLTENVRQQQMELEAMVQAFKELDFACAKGKLSGLLDGGEPRMNQRGCLRIIQGRHPLIPGKVVPITIDLGGDFDSLVITGPNTGGKTVTLKTVGLLTLMAQSGLHVPAETGTELAVFTRVFADIGDEQSIEQSLSTFSSHMTNIIGILEHIDAQSLVLLDELGAGTDPTEGAALAMAILDHLLERGVKTIATTHYSELKAFAYNRQRVENASVEFDVETLSPTYRLLIGVPGKSNAFDISRRLGLSADLVEQAKELLTKEQARVAHFLENLETNQQLSEKDRQDAELMKRLAQGKLVQMEQREQELQDKAQQLVRKAQAEALEIVKQARRESEAIVKELREAAKNLHPGEDKALQTLRSQLKEKEALLEQEVYKRDEKQDINPQELHPGSLVILKRLNQRAQVLEKPNTSGEVYVQAGIMKLCVSVKDLAWAEGEKKEGKKQKTGTGDIYSQKAKDINSELDLRGLMVEEAILETEKYLDDAYLAGLTKAYLIHGKGTGALRSAIQDLVKHHRFIETARIGGYYEGGHGVTVVEFIK